MSSTATHDIACYGGRDRNWHGAVLEQCGALRLGFEPSRWMRNAHVPNVMPLAPAMTKLADDSSVLRTLHSVGHNSARPRQAPLAP
jgi:hypothetical protein